jgi:hypothetical protein
MQPRMTDERREALEGRFQREYLSPRELAEVRAELDRARQEEAQWRMRFVALERAVTDDATFTPAQVQRLRARLQAVANTCGPREHPEAPRPA